MQSLKDEEVMLSYQKGQVQAMDELLRRYKKPVYCFVLRLTGNISDAQEIAQEVFLRLHQCRDSYQPTGKFSTWIFSIAHNLTLSRWRKNKWFGIWPSKKDEPDELKEFESSDPSPEELAFNNEQAIVLKKCVQSLPFLQKEALILREYEDLDYQQIAKILKRSIGAVKTLIHRARMNLKTKLLPYIEEFGGGYNE